MNMIGTITVGSNYTGPLRFEHDGIPTYEDCRQLIREYAHALWVMEGKPDGKHDEHWLRAERDLFWQQENHLLFGGYKVYVRDRTKPKLDNFYEHWFVAIISPNGVFKLVAKGGELVTDTH